MRDHCLKTNKARNYGPPQGHAGDMNSRHQTSLNPTGLFSLNPRFNAFNRNKVINFRRWRWGKIYQSWQRAGRMLAVVDPLSCETFSVRTEVIDSSPLYLSLNIQNSPPRDNPTTLALAPGARIFRMNVRAMIASTRWLIDHTGSITAYTTWLLCTVEMAPLQEKHPHNTDRWRGKFWTYPPSPFFAICLQWNDHPRWHCWQLLLSIRSPF